MMSACSGTSRYWTWQRYHGLPRLNRRTVQHHPTVARIAYLVKDFV